MNEEIKMVGERNIDKETRRMKIDSNMIDVLLPMMLNNTDKNASELEEEEFYLLDCLVKCMLVLVNIDVDEDYSVNVNNLLGYCRQEHKEKRTYNYTYVALTQNNVDRLINWLLKKGMNNEKLSNNEENTLEALQNTKESFYDKVNNEKEWFKVVEEMEKIRMLLNIQS